MIRADLAQQIWSTPAFQADYEALIRHSMALRLGLDDARRRLSPEVHHRLGQSAVHLAHSSAQEVRHAAYRIATTLATTFRSEFAYATGVAEYVLSRLGNFPSVDRVRTVASEQNYEVIFPAAAVAEDAIKRENNTVQFLGEHPLLLTDFQVDFWHALQRGSSAAVSAPTSAGKSFVLQRYVVDKVLRQKASALYLVPTRALISQVSQDIVNLIRSTGSTVNVHTIPVLSDDGAGPVVYVLTQERLQLLLDLDFSIKFDLIVVDESQSIADDSRGVILQDTIETAIARNPTVQLLFGSPQTRNLDVFRSVFGIEQLQRFENIESTVAQNLVFVDTIPAYQSRVTVSADFQSSRTKLGEADLGTLLADNEQTLAVVAAYFGKDRKSIVYAGGQAKCEGIASHISQLLSDPSSNTQPSEALAEFADFVSQHVHPDYGLVETAKSGVAYHYGNMPAILRKYIEDLYSGGAFSHLVCTSTLLQGVNLPAQNLFLLNPTKGRDWEEGGDRPISSQDFWNLAGRAGRLGKEFEGNVFVVNVDSWIDNPLEGDRLQNVTAAFDSLLLTRGEEFRQYISDQDHRSGDNGWMETSFTKAVCEQRSGRLSESLHRVFTDSFGAEREQMLAQIEHAASLIDVPDGILRRNLAISPYRQQEMLDYLVETIRDKNKGVARVMPLHPLREWNEVVDNYRLIFRRIHGRFEKKAGTDRSQFYWAPQALLWMRGVPLPQLINSKIEYNKKQNRRQSVSVTIRSVMAEIENDLRFRYVKYTSAYCDLLAEALRRTDNEPYCASIPTMSLYLELGASSSTMLSFIEMGLTRTSAALLTKEIPKKDYTIEGVKMWLKSQNLRALPLPRVVIEEAEKFKALVA